MGRSYHTRHTSHKDRKRSKKTNKTGLFYTYGMTHTEVYRRSNRPIKNHNSMILPLLSVRYIYISIPSHRSDEPVKNSLDRERKAIIYHQLITIRDLLHGRQACPEFIAFDQGVGQICPW